MESIKGIIFLKSICFITIIHSICAMDTTLPLTIMSQCASKSLFKACVAQQWNEANKLIKTVTTSLLLQPNHAGQIPLYFIVLWNVGKDTQKKQQKRELIQEYCARFGNNAHILFEHTSWSHETELTLWDRIVYNGCPIATEAAIIAFLLKSRDKSFMLHKAGRLIKQTPLHTMVIYNNMEAAKMILDAAGDDAITLINEQDSYGDSPFMIACLESRIDILNLFYPYVIQDWALWLRQRFLASITIRSDMYQLFS